MKNIIKILILVTSVNGFSQQIDLNIYIEITSKIIKSIESNDISEINELDTIFVNSYGLIFGNLDTIIDNSQFVFSNSKVDLFFWGANSWFETIRFKQSDSLIEYDLCINSFKKIENIEYYCGTYIFENINDSWILKEKKIEKFTHENIPKLDKPLIKQPERKRLNNVKHTNFNLDNTEDRKFETLADTLIGNWQYLADSVYWESLCIHDSIYSYSLLTGKISPMRYEIVDNNYLISGYDRFQVKSKIKVIDLNTIVLSGLDMNIYSDTLYRIPDSEFTYSDIKYYKMIENEDGSIEISEDEVKFREGFLKRQHEFIK